MMKSQNVYSRHIDTVAYDDSTQELHVKFSKGKTAVYSGVPVTLASSVMNAPSVGAAVHAQIKGSYPHRYL
jgi:KTSC domain